MKKRRFLLYAALAGFAYGLILLLASRLLILRADSLFRGISTLTKLSESDKTLIVQALGQLRTARVSSPWLPVLLVGAAIGTLYLFLIRRCKRKWLLSCCLWGALLLPLTLTITCFTEINDVRPANIVLGTAHTDPGQPTTSISGGTSWYCGFGRRQILPDESSPEPLYIAGYQNGAEITGVLDYCEARAVWLDTGGNGILLIGIDCVALDSGTVATIREALSDLPNCEAIHVYATHTHAGIDTLGLWGPIAINGKNSAYMEALIQAAAEAGREAAANRAEGAIHFGQTTTEDMYRDSRDPQVYDANLYQLRFSPAGDGAGLRMFFYGAHAESLRGANTLLSRDFPGLLCDQVTEATGDDTMFFPGAIGGLIMTKEFFNPGLSAERNLTITADRLTEYALSIAEEDEVCLSPQLACSTGDFVVPMDNFVFLLYKALGILDNHAVRADSATGYGVQTELSILLLDDLAVALLPGEIFPELVYGGAWGDANPACSNPEPLYRIAEQNGIDRLLIVGLANDEIGYIVPPSDFLLNETTPYLDTTMDYKGENHYEETNSVGPECAHAVAEAFRTVLNELVSDTCAAS